MRSRFTFLTLFLFLASLTIPATRGDAPPAGHPQRTDRYGDPLPDGAVFRIGTTRLRPGIMIIPAFKNVLISPDRKFVFSSGGEEPLVYMWETSTGREVRRFPGESSPMFSLSADGSLLAVSVGYEISLYNTATGKKQRTVDLDKLKIPGIDNPQLILPQETFCPDGKILTAFQSEGSPRSIVSFAGKHQRQGDGDLANGYRSTACPLQGCPAHGVDRRRQLHDSPLGNGHPKENPGVESGCGDTVGVSVPDLFSR
jgi:hypothetical protein